MRRPHATTQWLAALIIASAAVAASTYMLEIITAPGPSVLVEFAIAEAHTIPQPTMSDFTTEELMQKIGVDFIIFIITTTPVIFLIALIPAFILSEIWESWSKPSSTLVYAIGGFMTGLAFCILVLSPLAPLGPGFFSGPELTPLRFLFLGATAGVVGGLVFGWRRQAYFRLFHPRQTAK